VILSHSPVVTNQQELFAGWNTFETAGMRFVTNRLFFDWWKGSMIRLRMLLTLALAVVLSGCGPRAYVGVFKVGDSVALIGRCVTEISDLSLLRNDSPEGPQVELWTILDLDMVIDPGEIVTLDQLTSEANIAPTVFTDGSNYEVRYTYPGGIQGSVFFKPELIGEDRVKTDAKYRSKSAVVNDSFGCR
jgi:hypothetical protein